MLVELRLRNLAVAADAVLSLGPGLNVLSGSTGAGKSLAVEALRWLRGENVDRGVLRSGAESASAEALFDLQGRDDLVAALEEIGVDAPEDGVLRLRREVRREGRSRAWVAERLSSAAVLRAITDHLVELQSQHQQTSLLDPAGHAELLDRAGVSAEVRASYRAARRRWRAADDEWQRWRDEQARLREQRDLLAFQHRELEDARLRGDEIDELRSRVAVLEGGARLLGSVHEALGALSDEEHGASLRLGEAHHALRSAPDEISALAEARELLASALDLVADAQRALEDFGADRDFDPRALEDSQERLAQLEHLMRKYGRTEAELVDLRDRLGEQLAGLDDGGRGPARLEAEREAAREALQEAAKALQRERKQVARRLERDAPVLLEELGMRGAALRFDLVGHHDAEGEIRLEGRKVRAMGDGPAAVRLSVRTNPGEEFGPVQRVASGGELSRIGLVLRSLALEGREPALVLLDEVDAGLGADLGPAMARRLGALAGRAQLLVITHLPAVAAAASRHLVARKDAEDGRTESRVEVLDEDSRIEELARMLGGKQARALEMARELRRDAQRTSGDRPARAKAGREG